MVTIFMIQSNKYSWHYNCTSNKRPTIFQTQLMVLRPRGKPRLVSYEAMTLRIIPEEGGLFQPRYHLMSSLNSATRWPFPLRINVEIITSYALALYKQIFNHYMNHPNCMSIYFTIFCNGTPIYLLSLQYIYIYIKFYRVRCFKC
jgi:hypothetical protein